MASTQSSSSSSSSSLEIEKIQFQGPRPFIGSIRSLNTSSAPISYVTTYDDSTSLDEPRKKFGSSSRTSRHLTGQQTTLPGISSQPSRKDEEIKINCWNFSLEVHASNTERETRCIFCCCICFK